MPPYSCSLFFFIYSGHHRDLHSFPTRRSSDLQLAAVLWRRKGVRAGPASLLLATISGSTNLAAIRRRSEEHTSELQSLTNLVCRLLLEKKKKKAYRTRDTGLDGLQ